MLAVTSNFLTILFSLQLSKHCKQLAQAHHSRSCSHVHDRCRGPDITLSSSRVKIFLTRLQSSSEGISSGIYNHGLHPESTINELQVTLFTVKQRKTNEKSKKRLYVNMRSTLYVPLQQDEHTPAHSMPTGTEPERLRMVCHWGPQGRKMSPLPHMCKCSPTNKHAHTDGINMMT